MSCNPTDLGTRIARLIEIAGHWQWVSRHLVSRVSPDLPAVCRLPIRRPFSEADRLLAGCVLSVVMEWHRTRDRAGNRKKESDEQGQEERKLHGIGLSHSCVDYEAVW